MPPELLSLISRKEVAHLLKVSTRTIARWELTGALRPIRLSSRAVRYNLCDVQQFVADGQILRKGVA